MTLHTADGLRLVGELALPEDRPAVATIVCLHPLPTMGGMMDSHLLRKAANRLPALAGIAVLRFNTRGTESEHGRSEGEFSAAVDEQYDVAAALDLVESRGCRAVAGGWSFGTDLAIRYGCDPSVAGAILISPPLRYSGGAPAGVGRLGKPLVAIVPEHDDFLQPAEARTGSRWCPRPRWWRCGCQAPAVGRAEEVLDEVVRHVAPDASPLPQHWSSPSGGDVRDEVAPRSETCPSISTTEKAARAGRWCCSTLSRCPRRCGCRNGRV